VSASSGGSSWSPKLGATHGGGWARWADQRAEAVHGSGRWRRPRDLDGTGPEARVADSGEPVVSFASNDYLRLSQHPAVVAAAHDAIDRWGTGAGSARLIVGSRPVHSELESRLASWKGSESAVTFPTGYMANLGVLGAIGGPGVRVCSDELNHASVIDGCRLSRADVVVYRHRDLDHLAWLLDQPGAVRQVVVSDVVFSMDGDMAPVEELLELCGSRDALLVVDEAHSVLGPDVATDAGAEVLRVGTLSKTLGSLGGFVAGSTRLINLVVNLARPYIFTTAPTPADSAAALSALDVLCSAEGAALCATLAANVDRLAPGHLSPILPVVIGSEEAAMEASELLLARGLLVPAIRPPTVAPGTSRLRVALSAAHTRGQIDLLSSCLEELDAAVTSAP
jgi:8-amino-7-oxononanoate synthase